MKPYQCNHILENVIVSESSISKSILILNERRRLSSLFVKKNENEFEVIYPRSLYKAAKRIGLEIINAFILDIDDEDMLFFLANIALRLLIVLFFKVSSSSICFKAYFGSNNLGSIYDGFLYP